MRIPRLVPIVLVVGGMAWELSEAFPIVAKVTNSVKVVAAQWEIGSMRDAIRADVVAGLPVPAPESPETLRSYLRSIAKKPLGGDPSMDPWGRPYGMEFTDDGNLLLYSAGPNGKRDNACKKTAAESLVQSASEPAAPDANDDICLLVRVKL